MLTVSSKENSGCLKLLGLGDDNKSKGGLISSTTSLLASPDSGCGLDTCSFYSGPSDAAIMAFGESAESCGSVAYSGETAGSIAFSGAGGETCGSVASSSCGGGFSGGGGSTAC